MKNDSVQFEPFFFATGLLGNREGLLLRLLKINLQIDSLKKLAFTSCTVYVTFNEEESQRRVLDTMVIGSISSFFDNKNAIDANYIVKGNILKVNEAPEPSSIIYENLDVTFGAALQKQLISWLIMGVALVATWYSVNGCFIGGQPGIGAVMISFWNVCLPILNKYLVTYFELHATTESVEDSFIAKTTAARGFCSSIILYYVGLIHPTHMLGPYYISSIQAVLLADALTSPIIRLLDLGGSFKRYILTPLAGTDDRAKTLNAGTDYLLAER
jgi:hypothetical protein